MMMPSLSRPLATPISAVAPTLQILTAALMGVALLWAVGFSTISVVHNAAHDMRHSNAFPCH